MVNGLILAALLALHLTLPWNHAGARRPPVSHASVWRANVDGWTLDIHQDRFTYRRVCTLHRDHIHYERRTLVFHLPPQADTSRADYRIDNGTPHWVSEDAMDLARLGFALHDDSLDNPSGGVVRITLARLAGGGQVAIETRPFGSWRRFNARGIQTALAYALTECGEADFDRPTDLSN